MVQGGLILGVVASAEAQAPQSHLQWRPSSKVRSEVKTDSQVHPVSHVQLAAADGQSLAQNTSPVPPADPFNDPFGDQIKKYSVAEQLPPPSRFSAPAAPEKNEPMLEEPGTEPPTLEEPSMTKPMQPAPMQPTPMQPAPIEQPMNVEPMPATPQPGMKPVEPMSPPRKPSELPPPLFRTQPEIPKHSTADCEKVYKDRNCCEESDNCKEIREELGRFSIRKISLDISAPFAPDEDDPAIAASAQAQAMQASPSRPWRNIQGELVADGRMLSINDRRVVIDTGKEIKRVRIQDLGSDEKCFLTAYWNLPYECGWTDQPFMGRHWAPLEVNWTASALCHKPLYFEERALERYGHTAGPITQPIISGAHFFGSFAVLPYQMGMYPPMECQYELGLYRPGNCAPYLVPPVPLSARGAAAQAGAVLGALYWVP